MKPLKFIEDEPRLEYYPPKVVVVAGDTEIVVDAEGALPSLEVQVTFNQRGSMNLAFFNQGELVRYLPDSVEGKLMEILAPTLKTFNALYRRYGTTTPASIRDYWL